MKEERNIIFYDGDCGFCNKSIQFVLKNEKSETLYFSSLQSSFTTTFFETHNFSKPDLSTFYFYKNGVIYEKSSAALKLIPFLKWPSQLLKIGYLIPQLMRDKMYDFVAKRRKKIATGFCVLPTKDQQNRFLL